MGFPYKRIGSSPTSAGKDGGAFDKFDHYYAEQAGQMLQVSTPVTGSGINATGGTITEITQNGLTWNVHTFTGSGTFAISSIDNSSAPTDIAGKVEYLVVAGGGSGPNANGGGAGGGGAGGYRANVGQISPIPEPSGGEGSAEPAFPVSAGSYTITVGGGAAATTSTYGNTGSDSSLGPTIVSEGGGYGNCSDPGGGGPGGSGGGGGEFSGPVASAGSGATGQGFNGGTGTSSGTNAGAGGGGAGALGGNGDSTNGSTAARAGGIGRESIIDGTATYRAGGGGASGNSRAGGNGGLGGGGGAGAGASGSDSPNGYAAGEANTGGGGGGRYVSPTESFGGGSGVVIIRYALS